MLTKVHIVKAIVFPVVMYRCESWITKKAQRNRINIFKLWSLRRLLRLPWTARRSSQSILKGINLEYSLESDPEAKTPMLWPHNTKSPLIGKDPGAGKD